MHPAELAAYGLLGILGGAISLLFCKTLLAVRGLFHRLPAVTASLQPAIGGLLIGLVLAYAPAIMGVGYEHVDLALNGGMVLKTLVLLCVLKLGATIISYASGNAGGIFAPALYIGAMAGGAVGTIVHRVAPFPTGDPGAYALVGMGTLFAGIIRAPITSVFMIFEITQDYQILVPLMIANMLSLLISKQYQPVPVYHALLRQDQVHLPSPAARASSRIPTARQLMRPASHFIAPDCSIEEAWHERAEGGDETYLVGTPECLAGIVTRERLSACAQDGHGSQPVSSLVVGSVLHVHPDHAIDVVLERFAQSGGVLPVVARRDAQLVEGIITLDGIVGFIHRRRQQAGRQASRPAAADADAAAKPGSPG